MAKNDDDKIREGLGLFLNEEESKIGRALKTLRNETREQVVEKYFNSPKVMKDMLDEVDNAFNQLSKIKKMFAHITKEDQVAVGGFALEDKTLIRKGKELYRGKDYVAALHCFEQAIDGFGQKPDYWLLAGTSALYAKRFEKADLYADRLLDKNPHDLHALILKGLTYKNQNRPDLALAYFKLAKRIRPDYEAISKYVHEIEEILTGETQISDFDSNSETKIERDIEVLSEDTPMDVQPAAIKEPYHRRWVRTRVAKTMNVNDFSRFIVSNYKIVSLSAGGCLLDEVRFQDIPDEFQFSFSLKNGKQVWGTGERSYNIGNRQVGIKFSSLSRDDIDRIDQEVRRP